MARKTRSIEWRIFNAAIRFLEKRKLAKGVLGRGKGGSVYEDIYGTQVSLGDVTAVCAMGAVHCGVRVVDASKFDLYRACNTLERHTGLTRRSAYDSVANYNDRLSTRKGDIIKLLTEVRDACV